LKRRGGGGSTWEGEENRLNKERGRRGDKEKEGKDLDRLPGDLSQREKV